MVADGTTNPWGMDWDPHGEPFFINTVIGHLWHLIPGAHYKRMRGDDPSPRVYELIDHHADHVHWATGEHWTAARNGLNIVMVVNTNYSGGVLEKVAYEKSVNFAKVAEAMGCVGFRVEKPADVRPALEKALAAGKPAIVDIISDPAARAQRGWVPAAISGE